TLTHPDFDRYDLRRRTRYLGMPAGRARRLLTAAAQLVRQARHAGTLLRTLDVTRHGRDAVSLRLFFWAARLLPEPPFDVLHCHFGPVGGMVGTLRDLGAVRGLLATTFHGADLTAC